MQILLHKRKYLHILYTTIAYNPRITNLLINKNSPIKIMERIAEKTLLQTSKKLINITFIAM